MAPLPLYVLAGGYSTRFGSDKACADVQGQSMLESVVGALTTNRAGAAEAVEVTLVTGGTCRYAELGYTVIRDRPAGIGPIGGLNAALHHRQETLGEGWMLLAGCDLVCPQWAWVQVLLQEAGDIRIPAVAFFGKRWEPMLALYHTDLIPVIAAQLARKQHAMRHLLDTAGAVRVPLPDPLDQLPQANTPDELAHALREREGV